MQEIVNFLVDNPDVLEKVMKGEASLIGVDLNDVLGLIEGMFNTGKLLGTYWA